MKKPLLTFLTISSLMLGACGNSQEESTTPNDESQQTEQNEEQIDVTAQAQENSEVEQQTQFIQEGFDTLLNYDTETYQERNEQVSNYFTVEALEAMVGNEHIDPEVNFQSSMSNEKVYQSLHDDNTFVLIADVGFQVEDNPTTTVKNVYEFSVVEESGEYLIDDVSITSQPQNQGTVQE